MKHTTQEILVATQVFCDADLRECLADVAKPVAIYGPTIAQAIQAYQSTLGIEPATTKLIDTDDLYHWAALAESERLMIALIESRRAPGNMGHTGDTKAVTA